MFQHDIVTWAEGLRNQMKKVSSRQRCTIGVEKYVKLC